MDLKYTYLTGETPEERLRNKLQPLLSLVDMVKEGTPISSTLLTSCITCKEIIRDLLDDITPFYIEIPNKTYIQTNTLSNEKT